MADTSRFLLLAYFIYAVASFALTVFLARTLFKNGEVFLEDVFPDNSRMAASVNRLLVVGFYLLNLGYAFLTLQSHETVNSALVAFEVLSSKLGQLLVTLGIVHFGNLFILHRMRRRGQIHLAPPPVAPQLWRPQAPIGNPGASAAAALANGPSGSMPGAI
ncbi:MAG TPA: hypothetical protein VFQ61_12010 [Polyangiaceae bacterium]|nr:hypothetical protein [Polyangiaceae bacterium]